MHADFLPHAFRDHLRSLAWPFGNSGLAILWQLCALDLLCSVCSVCSLCALWALGTFWLRYSYCWAMFTGLIFDMVCILSHYRTTLPVYTLPPNIYAFSHYYWPTEKQSKAGSNRGNPIFEIPATVPGSVMCLFSEPRSERNISSGYIFITHGSATQN